MMSQNRVSRLKFIPGIGVDRVGNAADAARDPEILRLKNIDTHVLPPQVAIDVTKRSICIDTNT